MAQPQAVLAAARSGRAPGGQALMSHWKFFQRTCRDPGSLQGLEVLESSLLALGRARFLALSLHRQDPAGWGVAWWREGFIGQPDISISETRSPCKAALRSHWRRPSWHGPRNNTHRSEVETRPKAKRSRIPSRSILAGSDTTGLLSEGRNNKQGVLRSEYRVHKTSPIATDVLCLLHIAAPQHLAARALLVETASLATAAACTARGPAASNMHAGLGRRHVLHAAWPCRAPHPHG